MAGQFAQGTTVNLDIWIYEFIGGPLINPDGYPATEPVANVYAPDGTLVSSGKATKLVSGHFEYSYHLSTTAPIGTGWKYVWDFSVNGATMPVEQRTEYFEVLSAGATVFLDLKRDLRIKLKDTHPDETKRKYTDTELTSYIENAIWDINGTPPIFTYFTIESWSTNVPEWQGLIIQGSMIFALISQGIFEIGKEFGYSDNGISINIDRSGKYQSMANMLMTQYMRQKDLIKKALFMRMRVPRVVVSSELDRKIRTYAPSQWRIR